MKKILSLFHARWIKPQVVTLWEGYKFYFPNLQLTRVLSETNNTNIEIIRPNLQRILHLIEKESFDVIYCGEHDAVLIQYVLKKLGKNIPSFIIEDLTFLQGIKDVCNFIEKYYHENPYDDIIQSTNNYWLYYVSSFRDTYLKTHIPVNNLWHVPGTPFSMNIMNPEVGVYLNDGNIYNMTEFTMKNMYGKIFSGGTTNRDYETLLKACNGMSYELHIITDKRNYDGLAQFSVSSNIFLHQYFPLPLFISAIRNASVVVIPLKDVPMSCGHFTLTLAMSLKKPVIMTRVPSSEGYIEHGENGLLFSPGNADELRESILYFYEHHDKAKEMGMHAFSHVKKLSAQAKKTFKNLITYVTKDR